MVYCTIFHCVVTYCIAFVQIRQIKYYKHYYIFNQVILFFFFSSSISLLEIFTIYVIWQQTDTSPQKPASKQTQELLTLHLICCMFLFTSAREACTIFMRWATHTRQESWTSKDTGLSTGCSWSKYCLPWGVCSMLVIAAGMEMLSSANSCEQRQGRKVCTIVLLQCSHNC